jgi:hypothetical protein
MNKCKPGGFVTTKKGTWPEGDAGDALGPAEPLARVTSRRWQAPGCRMPGFAFAVRRLH